MRTLSPIKAILLTACFVSLGTSGAITGTVKFEGKAPKLKEINMDKDAICKGKHTKPLISEALVLGEGNTLANVIVKVTSTVKGKHAAPKTPVVLTQKGCQYSPHVVGVMANQEIEFLNPDGTMHNVHAMPKVNKGFNLSMPKFKKKAVKKFKKAEDAFAIKCDVHPWMKSYVQVFSHPYFSVSAKDGKYTIENLADGDYEIEAWHEKMGTQKAKVSVKDGKATSDFVFARK